MLLEDIDATFPSRITSSSSGSSSNSIQPLSAVIGAALGGSAGLPQYNKAIHSSIQLSQSHSSSDVTFISTSFYVDYTRS